MKVLLYRWKVFNQDDIKESFMKFGYEVTEYKEDHRKDEYDGNVTAVASKELIGRVREVDMVFSVNFFPHISDACKKTGRKYISWTVDSPMLSMFHKAAYNDCNYMFVFDLFNYHQFKNMGLEKVFYMPLAVNVERLDCLLNNTEKKDMEKYSSDISFVGSLYGKNSYDSVYDSLSDYLKGYFDSSFYAQLDIFNDNVFDRILTVDVLAKLAECVDFKKDDDSLTDLKLVFSSTYLGFKMAQIERIEYLNALAKNMRVDLYSDKSHSDLINVNYRGTVSYDKDMPKVFRNSKINLNITMRNIRSGLPLRVWDIMGSGGFLLTNFQAELPSYFEAGKDFVYYDSIADCVDKAQYYLKNEEERAAIATRGYEKVKRNHSYDVRILKILDIVNGVR